MSNVQLDGTNLDLNQVRSVARELLPVELHAAARKRVADSAAQLKHLVSSGRTIYGLNTGFGIFSDREIDQSESAELSENLILSHAVGVGPPFAVDVVRAAMLIRANSLAIGHSGVRPVILDTLLAMLNQGVTPWVPSQGSLGSSGDLAPLAHLALVFTGWEQGTNRSGGRAWYQGELMSGKEAMTRADIQPIKLGPKEGLALTNGATFSAALLALLLLDVSELMAQLDIAAALSLEALTGVRQAFDARLHQARNHPGQQAAAGRLRAITKGSTLLDSSGQIQDAYSLRCIPQIHGPGEELLAFLGDIVRREINAATDNPLLFEDEVLSGGNFHGQPLGLAADYLKLPLAEYGALAERRIFRLTSAHTSRGLPAMLVGQPDKSGLQSGLMMLQYTAASLALENQTLAAADSIHSLPTSGGQEDLNANSTTAARNLASIMQNVRAICAIELVAASQALDLRAALAPKLKPGHGSRAAYECVRGYTDFVLADRPLDEDIERISQALKRAELLRAVEGQIGRLEGWTLLSR